MVLAFVVTLILIPRRKPVEPAIPPPVKQVFATVDIPPHTVIMAGMLRVTTTTTPDPNVATDVEEVSGRIAKKFIGRDQPVLRDAMSPDKGRKEPMHSFAVPAMKRAIGLAFDPRSVARVAMVGDRVDIISVYKEGNDAVSRTVAQDCEVLATEEMLTPVATVPAAGQQGQQQPPPPPNGQPQEQKEILVVVAAKPTETQQIVAAGERGSLKLVMRNPRNPLYAQLEESWEHPHQPHKHYDSIGVMRASGAVNNFTKSMKDLAKMTRSFAPPPPAAAVWTPPFSGSLPPIQLAPKPKTVQVIKGTQIQNVEVTP